MKSDSSLSANKQHVFIGAWLLAMAAVSPALANTANDTYTWSAELVAVDDNAGTVTVQSLVVSEPKVNVSGFDRGDDVTVTWSGIRTAAGVRRVTAGAAPADDWLTLPVEFVSAELDGRYIRFSVPVPRDDLAKLTSLAPGQWITATSPRRAARAEEAVVDVRPYNDVANANGEP